MAKDGNPAGIEALYRLYFKPIYRFCSWQTNRSEDAEDLCQDIFIEMTKSLHTFRKTASFKNWLYVLARRRVNAWLRQKYQLPATTLLESFSDNENRTHRESEHLHAEQVAKLLDKLDAIEKQMLQYRYLCNYTVKETAGALHVSEAFVKVATHRSLKKLQKELVPKKLRR